jgi:hypothetical protein
MTTTTGTAVAVRDRKAAKDAPAEKLALPETLAVPAVLMLAAEAVTGRDDEERPWLQGVFLHSKDGRCRIAGTDGARMFLGSFPLPEAPPSWLAEGVILSNDGMRARVGMIAKANGEAPMVTVSYAKGFAKATMSDAGGDMQFLTPLCTGTFPDYDRVLGMQSFTAMDAEGRTATGQDWKPVGINSVYLKQCGDIAKLLDGGLPKDKRSKEGMIVRAYNGNGESDSPLVFDFSTWPGALLVIMPTKLASYTVHTETALLLTPALRGTIGALRGQVTRHLMRAQEAATTAERDEAQAQVADFQTRIAELLKRVPGAEQLEAPEPDLAKVAARRVKRLAKRRARARGAA